MVIDGDATSVEERLPPGHSQPVSEFSKLHGFQFVGARDESSDESASSPAERQSALTVELDIRAARFHQAVDSSIVLASDGTIRWLGDSVAKLVAGDELLAPRTILLVDEAISEDARRTVATRLELWLNATVQRLLGPLFSLRGIQEGGQQVQDLAAKVANALGVLEREPIRGIVRGLDQNARAILRRHGVRFGSYYLYVPSALKPASRALALQLWCLKNGDEELGAAAQGLIPMASSGRTSAPPDTRVDREVYRVAGFRRCGERVVRVDIVERLADMIRAASTLRIVGAADSGPSAFLIAGQMTSLTGCSGESFASILKSLGFESLTVRRSEIVWPAAPSPAGETPGPASEESAATTSDDACPAAATSPDLPSGAVPSPSDDAVALPATSAAALEPKDHPVGCDDSPMTDPVTLPAEESTESLIVPEGDFTPTSQPAAAVESAESHAAAAAEAESPAAVEAESPAPAEPESLAAAEDETITVWRFARAPTPHHPRPARQARRKFPVPREQRVQPHEAPKIPAGLAPAYQQPAEPLVAKDGRDSATEKSPHRAIRRKDWDAKRRHMPEDKQEGRSPSVGRSGGDRKLAIDPMSPFAKLMELRSILESESKKRS